jgi:DNA-directed RNA polymerase specialized sigma24 family protein
LEQADLPLAELIDLKYFCGFSFADIAKLRGVSDRTVQRDWQKARLYLHHALVSD